MSPSTDRLSAEATWSDPIDDVTLPIYEDRPTIGHAFASNVLPYEDLAILQTWPRSRAQFPTSAR